MYNQLFAALGIDKNLLQNGDVPIRTPIDGQVFGYLTKTTPEEIARIIDRSYATSNIWKNVPAPKRGELIRQFGNAIRNNKDYLAKLITIESGKILSESLGEVQEMIDICDFAVGLSRQLHGLTIASERPDHHLIERWHPLGVVGVISAFNFPMAVWAWNFALAIVCGNTVVWKPSEKTTMCALACKKLFDNIATYPELLEVIIGFAEEGKLLSQNSKVALLSATGSTRMGQDVAQTVAARFGKVLLELGGNNAMIVAPSADLDLALRAIVFSAVGTAGQRCTSLRRLYVHSSIYDTLIPKIKSAFKQLSIGNPFDSTTLVGPLIDEVSFNQMQDVLVKAKNYGQVTGGNHLDKFPNAFYVEPAIVELSKATDFVKQETFAPILYVFRYDTLENAIFENNDVSQGLSSAIFTRDMRESETFISAKGSDCGIANVNVGTSGAEIGGAFGGEKETGGGRESGSDSWKSYMRRMTSTVNYSNDLPLAQGINFN